MEILILVFSFLLLLSIGVPVAWSIGMSSLLTMLVSIPAVPAFTTVAQRMGTGLDSFALLAIPFFILAGEIMNRGGIARRLVDFAKTLVGALPGGLAHVNIMAAMLFGAIAGSAVAAASALVRGRVSPPLPSPPARASDRHARQNPQCARTPARACHRPGMNGR